MALVLAEKPQKQMRSVSSTVLVFIKFGAIENTIVKTTPYNIRQTLCLLHSHFYTNGIFYFSQCQRAFLNRSSDTKKETSFDVSFPSLCLSLIR